MKLIHPRQHQHITWARWIQRASRRSSTLLPFYTRFYTRVFKFAQKYFLVLARTPKKPISDSNFCSSSSFNNNNGSLSHATRYSLFILYSQCTQWFLLKRALAAIVVKTISTEIKNHGKIGANVSETKTPEEKEKKSSEKNSSPTTRVIRWWSTEQSIKRWEYKDVEKEDEKEDNIENDGQTKVRFKSFLVFLFLFLVHQHQHQQQCQYHFFFLSMWWPWSFYAEWIYRRYS